jgi:hypothetical protein
MIGQESLHKYKCWQIEDEMGPGTMCSQTVVLHRLNVIIDRLNFISSGSMHPCLSEVYPTTTQMQKYVSNGTIWQQYLKSDQVEIW